MSTVMVFAPIISAAWPVIAAAITAAAHASGFGQSSRRQETLPGIEQRHTRAELELDSSEILNDCAGIGEALVLERRGVRAYFYREPLGKLKVCLEGNGHTQEELRRVGEELIGRVTQQYVYHRIITELKNRNMTIVDEQVSSDETVRIRVRNL